MYMYMYMHSTCAHARVVIRGSASLVGAGAAHFTAPHRFHSAASVLSGTMPSRCCCMQQSDTSDVIEMLPSDGALHSSASTPADNPARLFMDAEPIFEAVASGDVLLLSGRWLLQHAGFKFIDGRPQLPNGHNGYAKLKAQALPPRQQLEKTVPGAAISADALRSNYKRFRKAVSTARNTFDNRSAVDDHVDGVPVIAVSHCWEEADCADPHGRTITSVAIKLRAQWRDFAAWGIDDVGVFFDWCSLYQNKPERRTLAQDDCFQRALGRMSMWYANHLTCVYIVQGQVGLAVPREMRGWPFYEESLARLFKAAPRHTKYQIHAVGNTSIWVSLTAAERSAMAKKAAKVWEKVVYVSTDHNEAPIPYVRGAPTAPSHFASGVRAKTFTNGADAALVISLYEECVRSGFDSIPSMQYPWAMWADAELAAFGDLLAEVPARSATLLKMTQCQMTHLDPLDAAIHAGALPNLRSMVLSGCQRLKRLPSSLASLTHLEEITLSQCRALEELPELPPTLRTINLDHADRLLHTNRSELVKLARRGVEVRGMGPEWAAEWKAQHATSLNAQSADII